MTYMMSMILYCKAIRLSTTDTFRQEKVTSKAGRPCHKIARGWSEQRERIPRVERFPPQCKAVGLAQNIARPTALRVCVIPLPGE